MLLSNYEQVLPRISGRPRNTACPSQTSHRRLTLYSFAVCSELHLWSMGRNSTSVDNPHGSGRNTHAPSRLRRTLYKRGVQLTYVAYTADTDKRSGIVRTTHFNMQSSFLHHGTCGVRRGAHRDVCSVFLRSGGSSPRIALRGEWDSPVRVCPHGTVVLPAALSGQGRLRAAVCPTAVDNSWQFASIDADLVISPVVFSLRNPSSSNVLSLLRLCPERSLSSRPAFKPVGGLALCA